MKRVFCFIISVISSLTIAHAQFDADSKGVLDKVSSKYQSFNTIEADIFLSVKNRHDKEHTDTGKLFLERTSGKFKIDFKDQEIISDGTTQWIILKDQGEVQINKADKDDNSLSPATIFTFYKKGYKGSSKGTSKVGNKTLATIALIPTDARQNISKIDLRVDKATHLIYDATVFDKNGSKFTYTVKNLSINKPISNSLFTFNKSNYPKLEIVDLR